MQETQNVSSDVSENVKPCCLWCSVFKGLSFEFFLIAHLKLGAFLH